MLAVAFLSVLFSSVASQQCADGSCVGNDETSLLQVSSAVKVNVKETVVAVKKHGEGKMQTTPWLTAAIGFLNKHVAQEGLWRKTGLKSDQDALVALWEGGDSSIPERMSADTVAVAVGRMLQKDPLFNDALTKQICKMRISQRSGSDMLLEQLSIVLGGVPGMEMPQNKFDDLKLLLNHWHLLLKDEPTNRMNLNTIIKVVSVLIVPPTAMAQVYDPTLVRGALKSQWVPNFGIMIEKPDEVTLDRDV